MLRAFRKNISLYIAGENVNDPNTMENTFVNS